MILSSAKITYLGDFTIKSFERFEVSITYELQPHATVRHSQQNEKSPLTLTH
jgi:hypothetical protein